MYAEDHNGQLPPNLNDLVPHYLLSLPQCIGSFIGCRPITLLGIRSSLDTLREGRPDPPSVPYYSVYVEGQERPQFQVACRRNHPGAARYFSESKRFESVWGTEVTGYDFP